ncbi:MAG: hypothetical protein ACYDH6_06825 [Acidimicrobiales bacterium]
MSRQTGSDTPVSAVRFGAQAQIAEGEFVPVALTIEVGRLLNVSVPLGAFAVRGERVVFVPTVNVVGLTAVVLGIGVGGLAIRTVGPIARDAVEKFRPEAWRRRQ